MKRAVIRDLVCNCHNKDKVLEFGYKPVTMAFARDKEHSKTELALCFPLAKNFPTTNFVSKLQAKQ